MITLCVSSSVLQSLQSAINTRETPRQASRWPAGFLTEKQRPQMVKGLPGSQAQVCYGPGHQSCYISWRTAPGLRMPSGDTVPVLHPKMRPCGWAVTSPLWTVGWWYSLTDLHNSLWLASTEAAGLSPRLPRPGMYANSLREVHRPLTESVNTQPPLHCLLRPLEAPCSFSPPPRIPEK